MPTPKLNVTNIKKYLKENDLKANEDFTFDNRSLGTLRNNRQEIVDHFGIPCIEVDDRYFNSTDSDSWLNVSYGSICDIKFGPMELSKRLSINIDNEFEPYIDGADDILVELKRFQESSQEIQKFLSSKGL